jgi:hypothetical protein
VLRQWIQLLDRLAVERPRVSEPGHRRQGGGRVPVLRNTLSAVNSRTPPPRSRTSRERGLERDDGESMLRRPTPGGLQRAGKSERGSPPQQRDLRPGKSGASTSYPLVTMRLLNPPASALPPISKAAAGTLKQSQAADSGPRDGALADCFSRAGGF